MHARPGFISCEPWFPFVHVVPLVQVGAVANGSDDALVAASSFVPASRSLAPGGVTLLAPDVAATSAPQPAAANATTATTRSRPDSQRENHTIYLLLPVPRDHHCRPPPIVRSSCCSGSARRRRRAWRVLLVALRFRLLDMLGRR